MFRFLRITLILWLLSVALIGGAALYGRAHAAPNELQALGFGVCEGRPCFMGITPGVTSWNEAVQHLDQKCGEHNIPDTFGCNKSLVEIARSTDGSLIAGVLIKFGFNNPSAPTIGSLIAEYGAPCRLFLAQDDYYERLFIDFSQFGATLYIYPEQSELTPQSSVFAMGLSEDFTSNSCEYLPAYDLKTIPWAGFLPFSRYKTLLGVSSQ